MLILNETKLESDSRICPKLLLEEAIKREYSKQGEMFSVEDMKSLAEFGGATAGNIIQQDDTSVLSEELTQHLIHGSPILIPYDIVTICQLNQHRVNHFYHFLNILDMMPTLIILQPCEKVMPHTGRLSMDSPALCLTLLFQIF